jgi:hypothetical protein
MRAAPAVSIKLYDVSSLEYEYEEEQNAIESYNKVLSVRAVVARELL